MGSLRETAADFVRVIAGEFGGRRLRAPRGRSTRPTSDRVREAMFMTLEPLLGLRVMDLYAGSGALGIEALSRGAHHVDFVESDRAARAALSQNLAMLALEQRSRIWPLALPRALEALAEPLGAADLVVADPPYGGELAREILGALGRPGVLRPGARMVIEHYAKDELPERSGSLVRSRLRRYGQTVVATYLARTGEMDPQDQEDRP